MKIYTDYNKLLEDSLQYSCHKVITSAEDNGKIVELLAVQMTRDNLELFIKLLRANEGEKINA